MSLGFAQIGPRFRGSIVQLLPKVPCNRVDLHKKLTGQRPQDANSNLTSNRSRRALEGEV